MELSQATLTIALFVLSAITSGLVAFLIFLFQRTASNERDLMQHKLDAAEKYAHKSEINEIAGRIERKMDDLFKQFYDRK